MKVKIELEKTVQVRQYEPLRVCISAEDDVPDSSHIPTRSFHSIIHSEGDQSAFFKHSSPSHRSYLSHRSPSFSPVCSQTRHTLSRKMD